MADHLAVRIESGELVPGSRLQPEHDLAAWYGVADDTIRRATALLRERGLIVTRPRPGTFVRE